MYNLGKVHKDIVNKCSPVLFIFCTNNTPSYKLVQILTPILKSLTLNKYTVKDAFAFCEKIVEIVEFSWEA